jgi:hypothetical protein
LKNYLDFYCTGCISRHCRDIIDIISKLKRNSSYAMLMDRSKRILAALSLSLQGKHSGSKIKVLCYRIVKPR